MASATGSSASESWFFQSLVTLLLLCGVLGYLRYELIITVIGELLRRLLMGSLLIVIVVQWISILSTSARSLGFDKPGSQQYYGEVHGSGCSPWGVALVLLVVLVLLSY